MPNTVIQEPLTVPSIGTMSNCDPSAAAPKGPGRGDVWDEVLLDDFSFVDGPASWEAMMKYGALRTGGNQRSAPASSSAAVTDATTVTALSPPPEFPLATAEGSSSGKLSHSDDTEDATEDASNGCGRAHLGKCRSSKQTNTGNQVP
ncbi:hypothetical protein Vretimale_16563, partial [Volvox reticuliferus]